MSTADLDIDLQQREEDLRATLEEAKAAAIRKPTGERRKALRHAQKQLEEFLSARLSPDEEVYTSIPQLVDFLSSNDWRIGTSTAYEHRDQGKLKLRGNGSISQTEALEYARMHLKKKDGSSSDGNLQEDKLRKDIARIDVDGRMRELKYRQALGELIEKSHVEIELADRATNLKNYFDAITRKSAGRMCKIIGGDPQKVPHLIEFLLGMNRKAFDNYARPIQGVDEDED